MKEIILEVKRNILGDISIGYYISAGIFCLLGILIMLRIRAKKRDPGSKTTPVHFSWRFLIWDNTKRIMAGMIVMFLIFRFTVEFLGRELNMQTALGIGIFLSMGVDRAIEFIQDKFSWLCMPREKYMEKVLNKAQDELENKEII